LHATGGFVVAVFLLAAVASPAAADLTNLVFQIDATGGGQHGSWAANIGDGHWTEDLNGYVWTLSEPIDIRDPSGAIVATVGGAEVSYLSDPAVYLSFAVVAGAIDTEFTVRSALLSFPTIANPAARASANFTLTDGGDDDGAQLIGLGGMAFTADYNGFVPGGTQFTQLIPQLTVAPGDGSANLNEIYPIGGDYTALGTPASDMSSQISFSLSANDLASGASNYELMAIPEPCGLLLVLVCAGAIRRR
jgi:hypothetical protein